MDDWRRVTMILLLYIFSETTQIAIGKLFLAATSCPGYMATSRMKNEYRFHTSTSTVLTMKHNNETYILEKRN